MKITVLPSSLARFFRTVLVVLGVAFLLLAASLAALKLMSREGWIPAFDAPLNVNATGGYLAARHAHMHGDMAAAYHYYQYALAANPTDPKLRQRVYQSALMAGDEEAMLQASDLIPAQVPAVVPTAILRSLFFAKDGDFRAANEALEHYTPQGFHALFFPVLKAWLKAGLQTPSEPFKLPEYALSNADFSVLMSYHAVLLNDFAGYHKEAEAYRSALLLQAPRLSAHVINVLARELVQQKKLPIAKKMLADYLRQTPDAPAALPASVPTEPYIQNAQQGLAEILYDMSTVFFSMQAWEESLIYARLALALNNKLADAHYLMASVYEKIDQPVLAQEAYHQVPKDNPLYHRAVTRLATMYQEVGQGEQALKVLDAAQADLGNHYDWLVARADILRDQKDFAAAAEYYNKAIGTLSDVKPYHWVLYFARGASYERAGQWEKAEPDFLKALALSPDQPEVLNYLGYSWLLLGKNLTQAKAMIEKALMLAPRDVQIVDSMGWALYQLGQFEEALLYLEQAADQLPQDATVNEHLGDVYWRLGREHEAMYQWQRALGGENHEPGQQDALRKKLQEGLPEWKSSIPHNQPEKPAPLASTTADQETDIEDE